VNNNSISIILLIVTKKILLIDADVPIHQSHIIDFFSYVFRIILISSVGIRCRRLRQGRHASFVTASGAAVFRIASKPAKLAHQLALPAGYRAANARATNSLHCNVIVYSAKAAEKQHFEADTWDNSGSRVCVRDVAGAEGCREATEGQSKALPNRNAQKQRRNFSSGNFKTLFTQQVKEKKL